MVLCLEGDPRCKGRTRMERGEDGSELVFN